MTDIIYRDQIAQDLTPAQVDANFRTVVDMIANTGKRTVWVSGADYSKGTEIEYNGKMFRLDHEMTSDPVRQILPDAGSSPWTEIKTSIDAKELIGEFDFAKDWLTLNGADAGVIGLLATFNRKYLLEGEIESSVSFPSSGGVNEGLTTAIYNISDVQFNIHFSSGGGNTSIAPGEMLVVTAGHSNEVQRFVMYRSPVKEAVTDPFTYKWYSWGGASWSSPPTFTASRDMVVRAQWSATAYVSVAGKMGWDVDLTGATLLDGENTGRAGPYLRTSTNNVNDHDAITPTDGFFRLKAGDTITPAFKNAMAGTASDANDFFQISIHEIR